MASQVLPSKFESSVALQCVHSCLDESDMIGSQIRNRSGLDIADVIDVVVDGSRVVLTGCPSNCALEWAHQHHIARLQEARCMWWDHDDTNVAELLLQHLFGLGTDVDRRQQSPAQEYARPPLPPSSRTAAAELWSTMNVRVGHPDVCCQIGYHTLGGTMEAATCARAAEVTRVTVTACFVGF